MDAWNHNNYCVPPEHVAGLCEAIEALFPWTPIVRKPDLVGYRLGDDLNRGAIYLRPAPAARRLFALVAELRATHAGLAAALDAVEAQDADWNDHQGLRVATVAEWEQRVAQGRTLEAERPELQVRVVRIQRPGDPGAPTDYLYQAWVRLGLLGPWRNTFELQALDPARGPVR